MNETTVELLDNKGPYSNCTWWRVRNYAKEVYIYNFSDNSDYFWFIVAPRNTLYFDKDGCLNRIYPWVYGVHGSRSNDNEHELYDVGLLNAQLKALELVAY